MHCSQGLLKSTTSGNARLVAFSSATTKSPTLQNSSTRLSSRQISPCLTTKLSSSRHFLTPSAVGVSKRSICTAAAPAGLEAIIFDCDGVIVESENIHRIAYNASFANFEVCCPGQEGTVTWSVEFYDMLANKVGGGKPKMRWYFGEYGWPTSNVLGGRTPETDAERDLLIDTLQEWKTTKYKDIIGSGEVSPRPGVLPLMDAAKASGIPVAVCSAGTKEAVTYVLENLLGMERFKGLDLYMAGDDVPVKKPDPTIYRVAAERLAVDPAKCIVVEDSLIGLQAALGAGMQCVITFTSNTADQDFSGAATVLDSFEGVTFEQLVAGELVGVDSRAAKAVA